MRDIYDRLQKLKQRIDESVNTDWGYLLENTPVHIDQQLTLNRWLNELPHTPENLKNILTTFNRRNPKGDKYYEPWFDVLIEIMRREVGLTEDQVTDFLSKI